MWHIKGKVLFFLVYMFVSYILLSKRVKCPLLKTSSAKTVLTNCYYNMTVLIKCVPAFHKQWNEAELFMNTTKFNCPFTSIKFYLWTKGYISAYMWTLLDQFVNWTGGNDFIYSIYNIFCFYFLFYLSFIK